MIKASMSAYKAQIEKYGIPISSAQYEELRSYASEHSIVLSNFRDYTGDISTIKLIIDDIFEIAYDFPLIFFVFCRDGRRKGNHFRMLFGIL